MKLHRSTPKLGIFLALGLSASAVACASSDRDFAADDGTIAESALSAPAASAIGMLGALHYGDVRTGVRYTGRPRALGYTFDGHRGDAVDIVVEAAHEDAIAWLLDDARATVARDVTLTGAPDTHVAHLSVTLPKDGTFTIVLREAHAEATTFSVKLDGTAACAPKRCGDVGATCGAIDDGCGGTAQCGTCNSPDTCGGAGRANQCGAAPPPPAPCTWLRDFEQTFGQAWNAGDVAFVTTDGAVHRGMSALDLAASKNQVPDVVRTVGSSARVSELRLLDPATGATRASRAGGAIYGLGDAMWHQVNGYAAADFVETTLVRLFAEPDHSYAELTEYFRRLTASSVALVPASDQADYAVAAQRLMSLVDAGQLRFKLGTGHALDFPETVQVVNGKSFAFQFSDPPGLDPKIGIKQGSAWLFWPSAPVAPTCR